MRVTAFIGSGRKRHSYIACEKFLQNLHTLGGVEYEMVRLSEYNPGTCKGCRICFDTFWLRAQACTIMFTLCHTFIDNK